MNIALSLRAKLIVMVSLLIAAITIFVSSFPPARLTQIARAGAERRAIGAEIVGRFEPGER